MLACTEHGRTFTHADHRTWLHSAGFEDVELVEPLPFTEVLVATRAGKEAP
jgi:hypothetical protein